MRVISPARAMSPTRTPAAAARINVHDAATSFLDILLFDLLLDDILDTHAHWQTTRLPCPICLSTPCGRHIFMSANTAATAQQSQATTPTALSPTKAQARLPPALPMPVIHIDHDPQLYACLECGRHFPSARYAKHLEKCLGIRQERVSRRSRGGGAA